MVDAILEFFAALPDWLYVFVISMLPVVELRLAVPIGAIGLELPFYTNFLLSVAGNLLPVPFILLFISKLLDFLSRFKLFAPMVRWLRGKADKHGRKVLAEDESLSSEDGGEEKSEENEKPKKNARMSRGVFIALMLFVALPAPGTGAWTGSLVAALFSLPKKASFIAIALGVVICGVIMCLASYGVLGFLSFLL